VGCSMRTACLFVFVLLLSSPLPLHSTVAPKNHKTNTTQSVLSLTPAANGKYLHSFVGQTIELDLKALGSAGYGMPQVSGQSVVFQNTALSMPPSPAGPLPLYIFKSVAMGMAEIQVPRDDSLADGFSATIEVRAEPRKLPIPIVDQENAAQWREGWTVLLNPLRQEFTPSLGKLSSIEVQLVVGNPGPAEEEVTMTLLGPDGIPILLAEKSVSAADSDHVSFVLPAGFALSPGKVYSIQLWDAGSLFGWKYVAGGYSRGDASLGGHPLLKDGRGTFLFRTFGTR
jgi:hypothetical protein